jgi:hypothetical protein
MPALEVGKALRRLAWIAAVLALIAGCCETAQSALPTVTVTSSSAATTVAALTTSPPGSATANASSSVVASDTTTPIDPSAAGVCHRRQPPIQEHLWLLLLIPTPTCRYCSSASPCIGDTFALVQHPQPASYGNRYQLRDIVCDAQETGVTCTNPEGHGFTLNRAAFSPSSLLCANRILQ